MRGVVALELVAGLVGRELGQHRLEVAVGVAKDQVLAALEIRALPVELELLEALQHREQAEVHRAHVHRRHFGLEHLGRLHALMHGHVGRAAGGEVDDRVAALLDRLQEGHESFGPLVRLAGYRVARVKMDDRRASFGSGHRGIGDLLGRDRQVGRHRRRVNGTRHGTADDDLFLLEHIRLQGFGLNKATCCAGIGRRLRTARS